eukprot:s1975_g5.t1
MQLAIMFLQLATAMHMTPEEAASYAYSLLDSCPLWKWVAVAVPLLLALWLTDLVPMACLVVLCCHLCLGCMDRSHLWTIRLYGVQSFQKLALCEAHMLELNMHLKEHLRGCSASTAAHDDDDSEHCPDVSDSEDHDYHVNGL